MKTTKVIYTCDCCKNEVPEGELITVKLPYQVAEDTTVSIISWRMIDKYKESKDFEICQECAKKIVEGYRKYIDVTNYPYEGWNIKLNTEGK